MAKKITINSCVFRTVKYPGSEGQCSLCLYSLNLKALVYQKVSENEAEFS